MLHVRVAQEPMDGMVSKFYALGSAETVPRDGGQLDDPTQRGGAVALDQHAHRNEGSERRKWCETDNRQDVCQLSVSKPLETDKNQQKPTRMVPKSLKMPSISRELYGARATLGLSNITGSPAREDRGAACRASLAHWRVETPP